MEKILKYAMTKVDEAEILSNMTQSSLLRYENGQLIDIINRDLSEFSLRVIKDGRLGSTCGTSYENYENLMDKALFSAKYGNKVDFRFPSEKGEHHQMFDPELASLGPEELLQIGDDIITKARKM
ncbi:MAG: DNA gyrase modulator, partial [Nitrospirota bacterium]